MENEIKFTKEVLYEFGGRMHRGHKAEFRDFVCDVASLRGFEARVENNLIAQNVVIGNPEKAEVVVCAHYDTPPRMPSWFIHHQLASIGIGSAVLVGGLGFLVPRWALANLPPDQVVTLLTGIEHGTKALTGALMAYMMGFLGGENKKNFDDNSSGVLTILNLLEHYKNFPQEAKDKIAFVLLDNEEKFLLGSFTYALRHKKQVKRQEFVNVDCVGVGKRMNIYHFNGKKWRGKRPAIAEKLRDQMNANGAFNPRIRRSGLMSTSDHLAFGKSKGACCLLTVEEDDKQSLVKHIHSKKDTRLDQDNIADLVKTLSDVFEASYGITKDIISTDANKEAICEKAEENRAKFLSEQADAAARRKKAFDVFDTPVVDVLGGGVRKVQAEEAGRAEPKANAKAASKVADKTPARAAAEEAQKAAEKRKKAFDVFDQSFMEM